MNHHGFSETIKELTGEPRLSVATVIDLLHTEPDHQLTTEEWACVVAFVTYRARRHYQQRQKKGFKYVAGGVQRTSSNPLLAKVTDNLAYERYMGRLTLFLDFVKENLDKSGAWVMFCYRCRFATFEAILEAQVHGIGGLFEGDTVKEKLSSYPLKKVVECQTILRKANRKPTDLGGLYHELRKTTRKSTTIDRMVGIYSGWLKCRYIDQLPEEKPTHDY